MTAARKPSQQRDIVLVGTPPTLHPLPACTPTLWLPHVTLAQEATERGLWQLAMAQGCCLQLTRIPTCSSKH